MPKIGFEQVIGQRLAVSHLQNAVRTGRVSQAYLISGEKGAGKMKLALAFAAALLCAQPKQETADRSPAENAIPACRFRREVIRMSFF